MKILIVLLALLLVFAAPVQAYDDLETEEAFNVGDSLLTALIVGVVVALIVTLIWRSKLKSVRFKNSAGDYLKPGSLRITVSHDLYLYSNITRIRRQQNSSSGGRS